MKRRILIAAACVSAAGLTLRGFGPAAAQTAAQRIVISASRFEFKPATISLALGPAVTLVLRSTDFMHGFSLPDFNLRADCVPGKEVELTFTPDKAGRFLFVCDNFCGEGHDDMSGVIIVAA